MNAKEKICVCFYLVTNARLEQLEDAALELCMKLPGSSAPRPIWCTASDLTAFLLSHIASPAFTYQGNINVNERKMINNYLVRYFSAKQCIS